MRVLNRRQVIFRLGGLAAGAAAATIPVQAWGAHANSPRIRLGAQTNAWAIDPKSLDSFLTVLGQIREIGYAGFETGFFNLQSQFASSGEARRRIAATGLVFTGIHIAIPFSKTDPATKLPPASLYEVVGRGGAALGARKLIFSGAPATTPEELQRKIEALNVAGKFAQGLGLRFAYHNHWWEPQSKIGELEALYTQTDPALVSFLLDAGWAYRGGINVPQFLRRHAARITTLHLRDFQGDRQVPLGQGTFPLSQVAGTLRSLQWQGWALNEEERSDGSKPGNAAILPAFHALRGAFPA